MEIKLLDHVIIGNDKYYSFADEGELRGESSVGAYGIRPKGKMSKEKTTLMKTDEPIEKQLWKSADKLRKNIDAAEYKHIVLGLIFLKYISDSFEELHAKLVAGKGDYAGADPEDKDEYKAENVFFVPPSTRWNFFKTHAKQPTIGKSVDEAMDALERETPYCGMCYQRCLRAVTLTRLALVA